MKYPIEPMNLAVSGGDEAWAYADGTGLSVYIEIPAHPKPGWVATAYVSYRQLETAVRRHRAIRAERRAKRRAR